jgi:hypothetical protein
MGSESAGYLSYGRLLGLVELPPASFLAIDTGGC